MLRDPEEPDARRAAGWRADPVIGKAIAVGIAVGAYGVSFGVLGVAAGMPPWLTVLTSVLVLAGGAQFAFVGVIAAGGNPIMGVLSGLLLNVRFIAFGLAIAPHLAGSSRWRRLLDGHMTFDEPVALALDGPPAGTARRFRIIGAVLTIFWIGATTIGAFGGRLLGDPETLGLDVAFPASFLALLAPWLRRRDGRWAAGLGAVIALALVPFTPPGVPIVLAAVGAVVALQVPDAPAEEAGEGRGGALPGSTNTPGAEPRWGGSATPAVSTGTHGSADPDPGAARPQPNVTDPDVGASPQPRARRRWWRR